MSDTTTQSETGDTDTPRSNPANSTSASGSLEDHRDELKEQSKQQAVEQVDATLAELKKLLADRNKAVEEYTPEIIAELSETQDALEHKFGHLQTALEAELDGDEKGSVNQTIKDSNAALKSARDELDALLSNEVKAVSATEKARSEAAESLSKWRKPIAGIKARQKAAADLEKEITNLATPAAHKHGEAYWKLGLKGTNPVEGQFYLEALIYGEPSVVTADELPLKIAQAWEVFDGTRIAAQTAALNLIEAQQALKVAQDNVAQKEKTQIPDIVETLDKWED